MMPASHYPACNNSPSPPGGIEIVSSTRWRLRAKPRLDVSKEALGPAKQPRALVGCSSSVSINLARNKSSDSIVGNSGTVRIGRVN